MKKLITTLLLSLALIITFTPTTHAEVTLTQILTALQQNPTLLTELRLRLAQLIPPQLTTTLSLGKSHPQVKQIQSWLNRDPQTQVNPKGPGSPNQETTYFGLATQSATKRFQQKYALPQTGTITTPTWSKFLQLYWRPATTYSTSTPIIGGTTGGGGGGSSGGGTSGGTTNSGGGTVTPPPVVTPPGSCSTISQYGITWTFDKAYPCGQFVNGDWWVTPATTGGKVTVTKVDPAPTGSGTTYRNGSMVNPDMARATYPAESTFHGYDGRADGYNATYSQSFPLELDPSAGTKSLISTESIVSFPFNPALEPNPFPALYGSGIVSGESNQKFLKNAAILTVVNAPVAASSFRPPFVGTTKPIFSATNLRTNLLPSLPPTASAPSLSILTRALQRPWITVQKRNWMSGTIVPVNNEVNYGREVATLLGDAALSLCSNYSLEQKKPILYSMIQQGIDNYYAVKLDPDLFYANGGFRQGRKIEILLAGLMLNNPDFLNITGTFQEDQMFFYGNDHNPPITLWTGWASQPKPYADVVSNNVMRRFAGEIKSIAGASIPDEWEQYPAEQWHLPPWPTYGVEYPWAKRELYSRLVTYSLVGEALAAKMLGLQPYWKHDAFFDYIDRWMNEDDAALRNRMAADAVTYNWNTLYPTKGVLDFTKPETISPHGQTTLSAFQKEMYLRYRGNFSGGVFACTESWSCNAWATCSTSGTQTRVCTDANSCGTTTNRPALSQSCTPPPVLPPFDDTIGLISHWAFDGDAVDSVGSKNGAISANPAYSSGRIGQAIQLSGTNYVSIPPISLGTKDFTVSAWMNSAASSGYHAIIHEAHSRGLYVSSGTTGFFAGNYCSSGSVISPNQWHFIATTVTDAGRNIYVDGSLVKSCGGLDAPFTPNLIGKGSINQYYTGALDDLRIYNRALSATEIQQLYQGSQARINTSSNLASPYFTLSSLLKQLSDKLEGR